VTITSGDYVNPDYRDFYRIWLDNNWLYTQKEGEIETEILPVFTREIIVESVEAYAWEEIDPITFSHNNAIKIISLVKWVDSARPEPQEIRLESILTNWQGEK
jgi:hypothetical protein